MGMERYYYLIYSLFFLGLLATALAYRRDLLRYAYPAIVFGLIAGPVSQLIYLYDYWRPQTIFGQGRISIEDSIFGAGIFGLAFVLYPLIMRLGFHVPKVDSRLQHRRFVIAMLLGATMLAAMSNTGINSVISTAVLFIVLWLGISSKRRDLFMPGLVTGTCFVLLAALVYGLGFSLVSTEPLANAWLLHGEPLGRTLAGKIPLTELIWFFAVGSFLSIFDLFTSGKVYQRGARPSNLASLSSKAGTPDNA